VSVSYNGREPGGNSFGILLDAGRILEDDAPSVLI
jgi:hypothetical protein